MFKLLKGSLLVLFLINLIGCSYSPESLKETYNDLASETSQDLKSPFDLSVEQNAIIDDYTKQLFIWHRRNKLPEYAQTFATLAVLVKQSNSHLATLKKVLATVNDFPHIHDATHLSYKMEKLARSLDNRQISQLEQFLNDEYQSDALKIKKDNFVTDINDNIKALSRFMNIALNVDQLKLISIRAKQFHDIRHNELHAEKVWNQQMITLLKQKDHPNFSAKFAYLWKTQDTNLKGNALQLQQKNIELTASLMKDLIISFTLEQRNETSKQLLSISNTLSEMSNE